MKRKHIYLGGTLLLIGLAAVGGYLVFAGPEGNENRTGMTHGSQSEDSTVLPVDVPPMAADTPVSVPVMAPTTESARYAMGGSGLGAGSDPPPPSVGGPSALPGMPDMRPSASQGLGMEERSVPGETASDDPLTDESVEPYPRQQDATAYGTSDAQSSSYQDEGEIVTRGQNDNAIYAEGDELANPLREEARAAFASEGEYYEPTEVAASRYDARDESAGSQAADAYTGDEPESLRYGVTGPPTAVAVGDEDGLTPTDPDEPVQSPSAVRQPSAPAPITPLGEPAQPLASSPAPADSSETVPAQESAGAGYFDGNSYAGDEYASGSPSAAGALPSQEQASRDLATEAPPPKAFHNENAGDLYRPVGSSAQAFAPEGKGPSSTAPDQGTGRPGDHELEGPQTPQISVEKIAPEEIQVGKRCTFTILVRNLGSVPARDVRLFDEVPAGTQLVEASPRPSGAGGQLQWDLGTLHPGDEQSVEIQLLPVAEGEIGSVATVQFAADASVRTHCTKPELEVKTEVAASVMIGEQQAVKITLHNPGSGDASGVVLLENVPDGMSHPHGSALEYEVGKLAAGETRELELILTAERAGIVQNRITARGDANLFVEDIVEFEVVAPSIAVSVSGPQRKYLEKEAIFTVAVENRGTAAARDVELVGKLPAGMKFISADKFGEYDGKTHSVYWSLAELPPSQRGEVELVALPVEPGEQRLQVKAGADLGLVDQAESAVQVEGLAAIKFDVTDVADPIEVDSETSYEIRVVNQGSKAATNVIVQAQLPPGMEAVDAGGATPRKQSPPGMVIFAPLPELSPKADATYRIDVKGLQPGDQRVRVQIQTDEIKPITEEESTRVYVDQ